MKQRKYFVSYNYGDGFGFIVFDVNRVTKRNVKKWLKKSQKVIKEILKKEGTKYTNVIILNIQEIK